MICQVGSFYFPAYMLSVSWVIVGLDTGHTFNGTGSYEMTTNFHNSAWDQVGIPAHEVFIA